MAMQTFHEYECDLCGQTQRECVLRTEYRPALPPLPRFWSLLISDHASTAKRPVQTVICGICTQKLLTRKPRKRKAA